MEQLGKRKANDADGDAPNKKVKVTTGTTYALFLNIEMNAEIYCSLRGNGGHQSLGLQS